jgi:type VII secretion integral membrane protein EccD
MAESRSATEPELCRVSVIGGNTQVDVALPASIPVTAFIADLVALVESRTPDVVESDDGAPLQARHWTLGRLGRTPIDPYHSLAESDVYDGELLVLRPVESLEPPALFDDVIDTVARLIDDSYSGWSPAAARWIGLIVAITGAVCAAALLALCKTVGWSPAAASVGLGVGVLALIAAVIAARSYAESLPATVLSLCGVLLASVGSALFVPGALGVPHLLLGAAVALLVAVVMNRMVGTGRVMFAAVATVATFGGAGAAVVTVWHAAPYKVAAVVVVCALLAVTLVPRLTVAAARLPVPPVPTAGAAIDPRDHEPKPTIEGVGAIGATTIPSAADLGMRASLANEYQTGMILGIAVTASVGSIVAAQPGRHMSWQGIALAGVVGLVLCLRGRAFADLVQAGAFVGSGCVIELAVVVGYGLSSRPPLPAAVVLLAFAAVALLIGVAGPRTEISPSLQRLIEIVEYLSICAIGPLVFWIVGVYQLARGA